MLTRGHAVEERANEAHDEPRGEGVPNGLLREHERGHRREQVVPIELHEHNQCEHVLRGAYPVHRHQNRHKDAFQVGERFFRRRQQRRGESGGVGAPMDSLVRTCD